MASSATVNDTLRIRAKFYTWDDVEDENVTEDPVTVVFTITDNEAASPGVIVNTTPTRSSQGVYYYDWTPSAEGSYTVTFVGAFDDGSVDIVSEDFEVLGVGEEAADSESLLSDETFSFAGVITPLCVSPDELLVSFPDALEVDIAEAIWRASEEINGVLDIEAGTCSTNLSVLEYIKAAAACDLSRTFGTGIGNESEVTLGDLTVKYSGGGGGNVNRATASTWCEIAAALRKEIILVLTQSKTFVKGSAYQNPIPIRKLRRETEDWAPVAQGELDGPAYPSLTPPETPFTARIIRRSDLG